MGWFYTKLKHGKPVTVIVICSPKAAVSCQPMWLTAW